MTGQLAAGAQDSPAGGQSLHGLALTLVRAAWLLLVGVTVAFYAAGIPAAVRVLGVPCSAQEACNNFRLYVQDVQVLERAGLSLHTYTTLGVLLTLFTLGPIYGAAAVLFWRRSGTWMAIFMSFVLILLGPTAFSNVTGPLVSERPAWVWVVGVLLALGYWTSFVTYYLFPNGRFAPRWAWIIALAIAVFSVLHAFPALLFGLGFPAARFGSLTAVAVLMMFAAGLAAQVYRYRAVSGPVERQQTKWIVLAFSVLALDEIVFYGLKLYAPAGQPGLPHLLVTGAGGAMNLVLLSAEPVVITLAIFRYRLWDVDLLIRRTLVYGLLSVMLALMYFGSVVGLEAVLRGLAGTNSNLAIIVSVLAIAALAAPLRRAVQAFIDRRFYRSQYDAAQVLAAFGRALRSDASADLQQLTDDLLDVVDGTLRPERASLWLRPPK
jgi:hypothetical protein